MQVLDRQNSRQYTTLKSEGGIMPEMHRQRADAMRKQLIGPIPDGITVTCMANLSLYI